MLYDTQITPTELTILMPCLNEAETIAVCVKKASSYLSRSRIRGEILIADNGSTDGSQAIARRFGARVVSISERGYGAALTGGIEAAKGHFVIMGDADDSYDFSQLDSFVAKLREGYDLVMGNRFKGGIERGAMPALHRWLGNPLLSFIGRIFFQAELGDFHCGLRGFNTGAIRELKLRSSGMEFASEMVVRCRLARMRIAEVPTTLKKDGRSRRPHLRTWRDGWRHLRFLLIFSPRWLFFYPGLALLLFGAALSILLLPGPVYITPNISLDIHTFLVSAVTILIGMQCILFCSHRTSVRRGARAAAAFQGRRAVPSPPHIRARAGRCANRGLAWPRRHDLVCGAMGGCWFRSPTIRRDDQNIDRIDREHRFSAAARVYSISLCNY